MDLGAGPFKRSAESLWGFILFFVVLTFFLWNLCPALYWRDPGEFAAIAFTLSVGHPTGSPTYSLIGKLFTFLPFGSLFQKINLISAVFGALTVFLVFGVLCRISWVEEEPFTREKFWGLFSASAGAAFLAVSPTFWLYSQVSKGYPQLTFWIMIISLLLLRFREEAQKSPSASSLSPRGQSLFFAAAFLYGLSLGTYGPMVLYLPAFILYGFLADRRWYRNLKVLALGVFFFLLGFSVYLYLPLRSLTNPFLDWGEPRTFSRFLNHLMDAKDSSHNISFPWSSLFYLSWKNLKILIDQFSPFGIFLGVWGAAALFRRDRVFFCLTCGIAFTHWLFFIRLWDMSFLYIPFYLIFSIWIGMGIFSLQRAIEAWGRGRVRNLLERGIAVAFCGGILLLIITQFVIHHPTSGKKDYYVPYSVGKEMLLSLPPKTLLFSNYSTMLFHGLQGLENMRPDVFIAVIFPLRAPFLYWNIDQAHYPAFDFDRIPKLVQTNSIEFFDTLFSAHRDRYPLYWDLSGEDRWLMGRLAPEGLLYRIQEGYAQLPDPVREKNLKESFEFYKSLSSSPGFGGDEEGRRFLKDLMAIRGIYYFHRGFASLALSCTRVAIGLMEDAFLYNDLGAFLFSMGKKEEALKAWQQSIELNPFSPLVYINRGLAFQEQGDYLQALKDLQRAVQLGDLGSLGHYYRGRLYQKIGQPKEALVELKAFMSKSGSLKGFFHDDPLLKNAKEIIGQLSEGPFMREGGRQVSW